MAKIELKPRVRVDAKGRLLIPKWLREQLHISRGDLFEVEVYEKGKILLTRLNKPAEQPHVKGPSQ